MDTLQVQQLETLFWYPVILVNTWWRTPGGSMREVVTLKMQETSFLLAWMTSDSRTDDTSNSASRMSSTCSTKEGVKVSTSLIPN